MDKLVDSCGPDAHIVMVKTVVFEKYLLLFLLDSLVVIFSIEGY